MNEPSNPGAAFKALHEGDGLFVMPNPWDVGSSRMLADLGFKALATSSAALAWTLGKPDNGVTRQEAIDHGRMMVETTGLPVNGDFESGYGDSPDDVAETIRQAIDAGIAGCSIEDKTRDKNAPLYELDDAMRRLEAAKNVIDKAGSDFVLTGRTEAFVTGHPDPLPEAIRRLAAYESLGVDVVYAPGAVKEEQVRGIVEAVSVPVNIHGALGGISDDIAALSALGVKRVSLGAKLAAMAWGGFLRAADALADNKVDMEGAVVSKRLNDAFR